MLLVWRKDIDDPVDGIGCSDGVQRGEKEMTGLGGCHGNADGFIVTHFAQQDNIRALAQGGLQSGDIIVRINLDLSLTDNALVVTVQVFQRVFQGNNMRIPCVVDAVNQAGKGGGLAAAGGAGDKDHALGVIGKLHNSFRNAKFLWIRQLECDDTDNG